MYLRAENALQNTGVALHNYLLRPLSLFTVPAKTWARMELPLNLEEMMDLLLEVHGHQILFDGCFNGTRPHTHDNSGADPYARRRDDRT